MMQDRKLCVFVEELSSKQIIIIFFILVGVTGSRVLVDHFSFNLGRKETVDT